MTSDKQSFPSTNNINDTLSETLPVGHMIRTMSQEHKKILEFLTRLDHAREELSSLDMADDNSELINEITQIAEQLIGAESHHQREEQVLFPVLEKRGITGPPNAMRLEHDTLRDLKHKLLETTLEYKKMRFEEFYSKVDYLAKGLVQLLRDHIYKEENILYPMALNVIEEESVWDKLKNECDQIGYCTFTQIESEE